LQRSFLPASAGAAGWLPAPLLLQAGTTVLRFSMSRMFGIFSRNKKIIYARKSIAVRYERSVFMYLLQRYTPSPCRDKPQVQQSLAESPEVHWLLHCKSELFFLQN
jgi:hypothetical protein